MPVCVEITAFCELDAAREGSFSQICHPNSLSLSSSLTHKPYPSIYIHTFGEHERETEKDLLLGTRGGDAARLFHFISLPSDQLLLFFATVLILMSSITSNIKSLHLQPLLHFLGFEPSFCGRLLPLCCCCNLAPEGSEKRASLIMVMTTQS